jgi:hypothetical protein
MMSSVAKSEAEIPDNIGLDKPVPPRYYKFFFVFEEKPAYALLFH